MEYQHLEHQFEVLYDNESEILILGSFPSQKSRDVGFYYGNPHNRFWKVLSIVFNEIISEDIELRKKWLKKHQIALWDVISSCDIKGSSDSSIKNVVCNDIEKIIANSQIKMIYTNGKLAHKLYQKYVFCKTGIDDICLPSTSPANAQMKIEDLIIYYHQIKGDRYENQSDING